MDDLRPLEQCGLAPGVAVGFGSTPPAASVLAVVGGPLPPAEWPLTGGPRLIGRGRAAHVRLDHPSVTPAHALLERFGREWAIADLGGGVRIDGVAVHGPRPLAPAALITIGAVALQVMPSDLPAPATRPVETHHRPPRQPLPPIEPLPAPPDEPTVPTPPPPPGWASLALPVVVGGVLAVVVHPTAGLFAAAAPVLSLGAYLDGRRRHRRDLQRSATAHAAALERHRSAAAEHDRLSAGRRRAAFPSPAETLHRAIAAASLWTVRTGDPEAVDGAIGWAGEHDDPVTVPLVGTTLGVAGPTDWAPAVARAAFAQVAVRLGPADVHLHPGEPWARWLPHPRGPGVEVVTAGRVEDLPERCTSVVTWDADGARVGEGPAFRPALLGTGSAERLARALARWRDPPAAAAELPDRVALADLVTPGSEDGRDALACPVGVGADGPVVVDLVADGPHALVAGTTGAGKSELLRAWITGLALRHPPTAVAFALVDYKGGSAFDACARLPHVAGVVTDLDDGLGRRLLVSLRAEVRAREERLRAVGATAWRDDREGPPRLVVVVDEFATLATELPDFLPALVDVARRGRSLGLHLILATQRPAGVVSDDIRANTGLRVCLRTVDPADSQDVLGGPEAAGLPADPPGRAWVRTGAGSVLLQVATTTGRAPRGPDLQTWCEGDQPAAEDVGPSDLDLLVERVATAWGDRPRPAPPWLPPLPLELRHDPDGGIGLVDRPEHRRQDPLGWDPRAGSFVVVGGRGSGRSTALATAVRAVDAEAYAVDAADDRVTTRRLVARLRSELDERRARHARDPLTVLAVDGYESLLAGIDDLDGVRLVEDLVLLAREGPRYGISAAITTSRAAALPLPATVVLALDDPAEYGLFGLRPPAGPLPPGRGFTRDGHEVQLALPCGPLQPATLVALPDAVELPRGIALRDRDLRPAEVQLRPGTPFVVAGPPRSGRSSALAVLLAPHRGPTTTCRTADDLAEVARWLDDPSPRLFAIDDGERLPDAEGVLAELVRRRHPDGTLVVAVRSDAWRSAYGCWLAELRPAAAGLALHPDPVRDAECWTVALPPLDPGPVPPGRGVLVDGGRADVVQVARGAR